MHLHDQLQKIAPGDPVIVLLAGRLALVGEFDMAAAVGDPDRDPSVDISLAVPVCICADPVNDVDPECGQHYPEEPADLLELIAQAITAGRGWELGRGPIIDGATARDVNAARAVLQVLLQPGRNGVLK